MDFLKNIPPPETFRDFGEPRAFGIWMRWACGVAAAVCLTGLAVCAALEGCGKRKDGHGAETADAVKPDEPPPPDLHNPVREAPSAFPPDSNLPRGKEIYASGPIELERFDPARDLVRFEEPRVWFESDHDGPEDDEDDHLIHRAAEVPLRRLVNLLERRGGKLKVQEAYRAANRNRIHLASSLHGEGRAVDLTCEGLSLSELAKLSWQAGFDFVLYEVPKRSGVHLHCSVKRTPDAPLPPRPK